MSKRDYYDILGVAKNASEDEIKKSYRKLAMQHHPDRNPGNKDAETKFKEATEAYEVLKDKEKRAGYDSYGHSGSQGFGGGQGGQGGFGGFDFNDIFSNFSDIFGDFGGGSKSQKRSASIRGSDLRYNVEITLKEAFEGVSKNISFKIAAACDSCKGSGSADSEKSINCQNCKGSGKIRAQQGFFIVERTCGSCGGSGQIIKNPCKKCGGEGRIMKDKKLAVKIPAGVDEGNKIRIAGEGEAGQRGGTAGDLYVFVSIKKHIFFNRDEENIYAEIPIKFTIAALGGAVEIPIIDGSKAQLKVPEGTQNGQQFRLKSKGMSILNSGGRRGDMFLKVAIETPVKLSAEEKNLLKKLDDLMKDKDNNPQSESFFKKAADFFRN